MDNAILQVCPLVMSHHNDNLTYDGFITARVSTLQMHGEKGGIEGTLDVGVFKRK